MACELFLFGGSLIRWPGGSVCYMSRFGSAHVSHTRSPTIPPDVGGARPFAASRAASLLF